MEEEKKTRFVILDKEARVWTTREKAEAESENLCFLELKAKVFFGE